MLEILMTWAFIALALSTADGTRVCRCLHHKASHDFGAGQFAIGEGPCGDDECGCRAFHALMEVTV